MKENLIMLLIICIISHFNAIAADVWQYTSVEISNAFEQGSGSKDDPYQIRTAQQLVNLSYLSNSISQSVSNKYFILTDDIVLNDDVLSNIENPNNDFQSWIPIGYSQVFSGYFDGQNHTISGLYINQSYSNLGLFGSFSGKISNINIEDSFVRLSYNGTYAGSSIYYVGILCGQTRGATIEQCSVLGNVYVEGNAVYFRQNFEDYIGGIFGSVTSSNIYGCFHIGDVTARYSTRNNYTNDFYSYCGGICGISPSSSIHDSYQVGVVELKRDGGIWNNQTASYTAGLSNSNNIHNSYCFDSLDTVIKSGELAYNLNKNEESIVYYQTLGEDYYPHFVKTGENTVYRSMCYAAFINQSLKVDTIYGFSNNESQSNYLYIPDGDNWIDQNNNHIVGGSFVLLTENQTLLPEIDGLSLNGNNCGISSKEALFYYRDLINSGFSFDGTLFSDIVLNENLLNIEDWSLNSSSSLVEWEPIGRKNGNAYKNNFDGKYHTIEGLYIVSKANNYGLFGYAQDATIKRVCVNNCFIRDNGEYSYGYTDSNGRIGGICALAQNTQIEECCVFGRFVGYTNVYYEFGNGKKYGSQAGGICSSGSTIDNCFSNIRASSCHFFAGLSLSQDVFNSYSNSSYNNCNYAVPAVYGQSILNNVHSINSFVTTEPYTYIQTNLFEEKMMRSGELTYLLNKGQDGVPVWAQTLGIDSMPMFYGQGNHRQVYKNDTLFVWFKDLSIDTLVYSNINGGFILPGDHSWVEASTGKLYRGMSIISTNCNTLVVEQFDGLCIKDSIFQIGNADALCFYRDIVNQGRIPQDAVLVENIEYNHNVLNAFGVLNENSDFSTWTPIGTASNPFVGSFDGAEHIIRGLFMNGGSTNQGLFNVVSNAKIRNVTVDDSYFYGEGNVGGICAYGSAKIDNCSFSGMITGKNAGGIGGYLNKSSIVYCTNKASIWSYSSDSSVGGIVGTLENNSIVQKSKNVGTITVTNNSRSGGLVGTCEKSKIQDCYNVGTVRNSGTSSYAYSGGLCAYNSSVTVISCFNTANVTGYREGSLLGYWTNPSSISNCYYLSGTTYSAIYGLTDDLNTTSKSSNFFASGELVDLLNYGRDTLVWKQTVGTDKTPVIIAPIETIPNDQSVYDTMAIVLYTSTDGQVVTPVDADAFGAVIKSNEYQNGEGKITFVSDPAEVGDGAFEECTTLETIILPNSITSLGGGAFAGCTALTKVSIPASVETFGRYVFDECEALLDVTNYAKTPQSIRSNTFAVYGTLHVLPGCKAAYQAANYWKNFTIVEDAVDPDAVQYKDGDVYIANKDKEVETLIYTRPFGSDKWQALYVPFSIPVDTLTQYGLQVAELNDSHMYDRDDDGVFEEVTIEFLRLTSGSTEANMPYMIRALEAGEKQITLTDVVLKAAAEKSIDCSTTKKLFTFTGTYSGVDGETMFANHYYAISGGALKPAANSNVGLKPQRWYMSIENRDGTQMEYNAPSIRLMVNGEWAEEIEEETTGLHTIGQAQQEDKIYTLEGVRVLNASRPGMYVQNGKIVVRK